MPTNISIITVLKKVMDPELQISIYDLGLIYDVAVDKKGNVKILMTLTSVGCPLFSVIQSEMEERVKKIRGVSSVQIDVTFDPPWILDRMSPSARKKFGI